MFSKDSTGSQTEIQIDIIEHCIQSDIWEDKTVEKVKGI